MKIPLIKPDLPHFETVQESFREVLQSRKITNFGKSVTKALSAVEGGLVASRKTQLIEQIRKMRNYGMQSYTYNATMPGLNGKMSEFHAIIGIENLKRIGTVLEAQYHGKKFLYRAIAKTFGPETAARSGMLYRSFVPERLRRLLARITN